MIYIDASSLLRVMIPALETYAVDAVISGQSVVVVSSLTELECRVQLRARRLGGSLRRSAYERLLVRVNGLKNESPYLPRDLPVSVFATALRQHQKSKVHLRSLDRLHLAAMEELGISTLMTHDVRQGEAARELGYVVLTPR